jgi:capsular polysaccharide biosynthesis protein
MRGRFEHVLVNHEMLIFRGGRIYPESFAGDTTAARHYRRSSRYGWFLLKNHWLRRGEVSEPSGLWAINDHSYFNYYHWMIDVLPRILRAEVTHPDEHVLLLPDTFRAHAYVAFTLQAFPHIQVRWIGARAKIRVETLSWIVREPGDRRGGQIREVARRVGALAGEPGTARRIYLSRADAPRRHERPRAGVEQVMRSHGFEIVAIDPARPWEQVRTCLGADVIAGVHGAALTNLIFMGPGGRLLELRHGDDAVFFDAFRPLSQAIGVDHHVQICRPAYAAVGRETNNADLIIDLDLLRENLRAIAR